MTTNDKQRLKVFLCHAPQDEKEANDLTRQLIADHCDVWLDNTGVLPGQNRRLEIAKAVEESDIIIICLSKISKQTEGDFQREINKALDLAEEKPEGTIYIIPARFEECEVPQRLGELEKVDLFKNQGYKRLKKALELVNARKQNTNPAPVPQPGCSGRIGRWIFEIRRLAVSVVILIIIFWVAAIFLNRTPCSNPSNTGILIKPSQDVELISDSKVTGSPISEAQGVLRSQGSIDLSGLLPGKRYSFTLNGKWPQKPNGELRKIRKTGLEGYWDFMPVTVDSTGNVDSQYLLGVLPPDVNLCPGQNYHAKFFVKDAANQVVLGTDDFLFTVEPADSVPHTLRITVSDVRSVDDVTNFEPIDLIHAATAPEPFAVKGDSPVTVKVQAFNVSGAEISTEGLDYHWELCCNDRQNKTPYDSTAPIWKFEPPTDIPGETLTITVSNENGYSINVVIPFKITPR